MSNRRIDMFTLISMVVAMLGTTTLNGGDPQKDRPPIPLGEILERGIEGRLGVRLGTIVEVTGEVVPNTSTAKIDSDVPFFLKIKTVDGRVLEQPVLYRFDIANRLVEANPPKIGDKFRYAGYEHGKFVGAPDGEFDYVGPLATVRYGIDTSFEVLSTSGKVKEQ